MYTVQCIVHLLYAPAICGFSRFCSLTPPRHAAVLHSTCALRQPQINGRALTVAPDFMFLFWPVIGNESHRRHHRRRQAGLLSLFFFWNTPVLILLTAICLQFGWKDVWAQMRQCKDAKVYLPPSLLLPSFHLSLSTSLCLSIALALFLTVTHTNRWAHWWGPTRLATVTMKTKMSNSAVSASSPEIDELNVVSHTKSRSTCR